MEHETFWSLARDLAHWEFELFLIFLFDVVLGVFIWPRFRKWIRHHRSDDDKLDLLERKLKALQDKLGIKDEDLPTHSLTKETKT